MQAISSATLYRVIERICDIGPRPLGSDANAQVRQYLRELLLRGDGYLVEHEFNHTCFVATKASLSLKNTEYECWAAFGSSGGSVSGRVVACGQGRPEEIPSHAEGAIGVVERGGIHESAKVANLEKAGIVACVLFVDHENSLYSARVSQSFSPIPAVVTRRSHAMELIDSNSKAQLSVDGNLANVHGVNLALLRNDRTLPKVLLAAHYDSRPWTQGANDNASGVACLLAIWEAWVKDGAREDIGFILFDGEELGLLGSTAFAYDRDFNGSFVINIDAIGNGNLAILEADPAGELDAMLCSIGVKVAAEGGIVMKRAVSRTGRSDHVPLRESGARCFWLSDHPNMSRETDVDTSELEEACRLVAGIIRSVV